MPTCCGSFIRGYRQVVAVRSPEFARAVPVRPCRPARWWAWAAWVRGRGSPCSRVSTARPAVPAGQGSSAVGARGLRGEERIRAVPGERVVAGQHLMQASSDIFLGWRTLASGDRRVERDFYVRQLRDWKGSADIEGMDPDAMTVYGRLCGWTLARAHARSGDRVAMPPISAAGTPSIARSPSSARRTRIRTTAIIRR